MLMRKKKKSTVSPIHVLQMCFIFLIREEFERRGGAWVRRSCLVMLRACLQFYNGLIVGRILCVRWTPMLHSCMTRLTFLDKCVLLEKLLLEFSVQHIQNLRVDFIFIFGGMYDNIVCHLFCSTVPPLTRANVYSTRLYFFVYSRGRQRLDGWKNYAQCVSLFPQGKHLPLQQISQPQWWVRLDFCLRFFFPYRTLALIFVNVVEYDCSF